MKCVYFASCEVKNGTVLGPIKIGHTGNLRARLRSLRTAAPNTRILAVIRGAGRKEEAELHIRFGAYRTIGEFFSPAPELVLFIEQCRAEGMVSMRRAIEIQKRMDEDLLQPDDVEWLLDMVFELLPLIDHEVNP